MNPKNTPHPKNFKPNFLENLSITFDQILHTCRGARPLSIQEVSRKKLGCKKVTIPKCEISLRGVWPHCGGQMSHFIPRNFWGPPTRTRRRRNFVNIFRGQGVISKKRKNVNGREIETGSGRGRLTSSSGSGRTGLRRT